MTTTVETLENSDTVGFARLHALVSRGYRPALGSAPRSDGQAFIAFTHPSGGRHDPPPVTLWSDGALATSTLLFPAKYVPEDGKGPPDWQRYILPADSARFATFIAEVTPPGFVDLYLKPLFARGKVFAMRFAAAGGLCVSLAVATRLVVHA